jgi:hypothetical protein
VHDYACSRGDARARQWRLFAGYAATEGVDFKSGRFGRFERAAKVLAEKRWHLDATIFYIEHNRATGRLD